MSIISEFRDNGGHPLDVSPDNWKDAKVTIIFDVSYSTIADSVNGKQVIQEEILRTEEHLRSKGLTDDSQIYLILFHYETESYTTPMPLVLMKEVITEYIKNASNNWITLTQLAFKEMIDLPELYEKEKESVATRILLVTDGQIGWGSILPYQKRDLLNEMKKYIIEINKKDDVQMSILAVEASNTNFHSPDETQVRNAAGADLASDPELIKFFTSFITFNGFHNVEPFQVTKNAKTVQGYVIYGDSQIPISEIDIFLESVSKYLLKNPEPPNGSWNNTIRDVSLVAAEKFTGRNNLKNDPLRLICIQTLINMFTNVGVSKPIVEFFVKNSFDTVKSGGVVVNTQLNSQLRDIWNQKLGDLQSVWVQIINGFVSHPYQYSDGDGIVCDINATTNYLTKGFFGKDRKEYPKSCLDTNGGKKIIMLPIINSEPDDDFGQVLRLAVRASQSHIYNVEAREDFHIFTLACKSIKIFILPRKRLDELQIKILDTYKYLTLNMLKKKVFMGKGNYSNETELSLIMKGNYPEK